MSEFETKLNFKTLLSAIDDYDAFLFDLWGVFIDNDHIYSDVVDVVNEVIRQKKVFFVSNTSRSCQDSFKVIKSWGINAELDMVYTAGSVAQDIILNKIEKDGVEPLIYHLGANSDNNILRELNIVPINKVEEANIFLLTIFHDRDDALESFDDMFKFVVDNNIAVICANPDLIFPKGDSLRYCAGYFASRIENLGGIVTYAGKPHVEIYDKVFQRLPNIDKNRILMIGDTFETDIIGANRSGIHSALVMTGNALKFHRDYEDLDQKMFKLYSASKGVGCSPTFVTKIC